MRLAFVEPSTRTRLLLLVIAAGFVYSVVMQVVWYQESRPSSDVEVTTVQVEDQVTARSCRRSPSGHLSCTNKVTGIEFTTADGRTARARTSVTLETGDEVHVFRDHHQRWQVVEGQSLVATTILSTIAALIALGLLVSAWRTPVLRRSGARVRPSHAGSPPPAP